jgi:hypothetical protein
MSRLINTVGVIITSRPEEKKSFTFVVSLTSSTDHENAGTAKRFPVAMFVGTADIARNNIMFGEWHRRNVFGR